MVPASLPASFSRQAEEAVLAKVSSVRDLGANVLLAVESGSRAWGFPSPDSDYDCRFLYVRPASQHLVLEQARDVIEFPVDGNIDVGGWDLRKALRLALAGNAVVVEWAKSPITYEEVPGFRLRLLDLLSEIVDPAKVAQHYLGLARSHIIKLGRLAGDVRLKKLFYLIRPIVALDWMEQRGFSTLPPMNLPECLIRTDVPPEAIAAIEHMIAKKSVTREMGEGPVPAPIASYLESRYGHHAMNVPVAAKDKTRHAHHRALADAFYRGEVEALDG